MNKTIKIVDDKLCSIYICVDKLDLEVSKNITQKYESSKKNIQAIEGQLSHAFNKDY